MTDLVRMLAILAIAGSLAGCNTIQGAGEDIERGGEAIGEAAEETEEEID